LYRYLFQENRDQLLHLHIKKKYIQLSPKKKNNVMNTKPIFTFRLLAILSLFFFSTIVFSQEKSVIYIGVNGKLTTIEHAVYMQKISTKSLKTMSVRSYQLNDSKWEKICSEQYKKLNDSTYQVFGTGKNIPKKTIRTFVQQSDKLWKFKDVVKDQIVRSGFSSSLVPLLFQGQVTEYYPAGNKKSISEYRNNEMVSNKNWNENGDKYIDNVFYSVDSYPSFNPGNKALQLHVLKALKDAGVNVADIAGSVVIGFVVMENGTIDGIKVIKGLVPNLNSIIYQSFLSLNENGQWTPAKLNNQTVRYFQTFPVNFISKQLLLNSVEIRGSTLHIGAY
jgi:hypothetical protein